MLQVTEASFARQVLRAAGPVLVCFGTRACPGRQALRPVLAGVSEVFAGRLQVATVLIDRATLLAEQFVVVASPTLMVFAGGDRQAQVVGFIPPGLVRMLAGEVAEGAVTGDSFWSPVEARFEDAVLIPQLEGWGFTVQRQVACTRTGTSTPQRGRIDLLVCDGSVGTPITLIESKRRIRDEADLHQAALQAATYARSLALPTFLVAAPRGIWVYRCGRAGFGCVRHFTSLELHQAPELLHQLLLELRPLAPAG